LYAFGLNDSGRIKRVIRKLSFITVIFISILLMSLSLYAGERRRGVRGGGAGMGLGSAITAGSSDLSPAAESHGILSLKVSTQDAEMYVDGRFIGLARDFKGPAVVSAPSGDHEIEFRYNGLSYKTNAHTTRARTTSLVYTFNTNES
jgi:hypothetical protein